MLLSMQEINRLSREYRRLSMQCKKVRCPHQPRTLRAIGQEETRPGRLEQQPW